MGEGKYIEKVWEAAGSRSRQLAISTNIRDGHVVMNLCIFEVHNLWVERGMADNIDFFLTTAVTKSHQIQKICYHRQLPNFLCINVYLTVTTLPNIPRHMSFSIFPSFGCQETVIVNCIFIVVSLLLIFIAQSNYQFCYFCCCKLQCCITVEYLSIFGSNSFKRQLKPYLF